MKGKKLLSVILAGAMVLGTMTFSAFAEETESVENEYATTSEAVVELETMALDEGDTVDDNLLLTNGEGAALVKDADYTVSYERYNYGGISRNTNKIYNLASSLTDITISGGIAYSFDWNPSMFFESNIVIPADAEVNIILDNVVLGEIQLGGNSAATLTLVGDNQIDSIIGDATAQLTIGGEGSMTGNRIGGKNYYSTDLGCPEIIINSGTYNLVNDASYSAAIGGSQSSSANGGITINGGTITASSGYGAAIGGGQDGYAKNITINGGTINVRSNYGAAIGGGQDGYAENITITGGTITATGNYGAAIGGGQEGYAENITITGGTITATGNYGAAIGGGQRGDGIDITINNGTITANGSYGAGIGGGQYNDAENITITGGIVNASSKSGAAIGGGVYANVENIRITGGTVTARCATTGNYVGAAIGSGSPNYNTPPTTADGITIENANVTASATGVVSYQTFAGNAVGCGYFYNGSTTVTQMATNVSIKCGKYNSDVTEYVSSGYYVVQNSVDEYEVVKAAATVVDTAKSSGIQVKLDNLERHEAIDPAKDVTYQLVVKSLSVEDREAFEDITIPPTKTVIAFDFSVVKIEDGTTTEVPVNNQTVILTLPTPVTDPSTLKIYHIKDGELKHTIEGSAITFIDDRTISFIAPSFSTYAVEYDAAPLADANITKNIEVALEQIPGKTNEYDIVLKATDAGKYINRLLSADLTFALSTNQVSYIIEGAANVNVIEHGSGRFEFNLDGIGASSATGDGISIGKVIFEGYCNNATFTVVDVDTNIVHTTKAADSIVDKYDVDGDGTTTGLLDLGTGIPNLTIETVKKNLTIVIDFPNAIADQIADYQDMAVTITGSGITPIVVDLGTDGAAALAGGKYTVNINDTLVKDYTYTVTVSGAGYRTARYNVTMTGDKVLNFWNNVKDTVFNVEEGNSASAKKVTFLAGDIVKDNNINLYDLSAVVSYFGMINLNSDTSTYKYAKYDLNRDGKIDSKDVAYVLVSWDN